MRKMHLKQSVNNVHKNKDGHEREQPTSNLWKSRPTLPTTSTSPPPMVDSSFHVAIWPVLAVAQCFGMMPIIGVRCSCRDAGGATPGHSTLRFRWCSVRVAWAMLYLVAATAITCLYAKRLHETGVTAKNIGGVIYFCTSLLCSWMLFRLARVWPSLIAQWTNTERPFLHAPYQRDGNLLLSTRIRMLAVVFFVLTFCDYCIYSAQTVFNYTRKLEQCHWANSKHLQRFFTLENLFIFEIFPFSVPAAVIKTLIDIINMVGASYGNVFVMTASVGLATRYRQIAQRLRRMADGPIPESTWAEVRMHYVQLCELLESVNGMLAPLILLSCANNLYFICVQLLNILDEIDHLINYLYYWYGLLYLVARTSGLFLCAGAIHDAAWAPLEVIRRVPTSAWNDELERFSTQIIGERPALSGMRFFYLTRKNLLTMAGTIVTYELVLMQFAASTKATDDKIESALASCANWIDVHIHSNLSLI